MRKLLTISLIYFLSISCGLQICHEELNEYFKPKIIKGKLIKKFRDKGARNIRTLIIENHENTIWITLFDIHAYLYDACSEGDSLYKKEGSVTFRIVKPSKERTEITLDCKWRD